MRKVCAKMVPKNLTTEQKVNRKDVSWSSGPPWEEARILQSCYHRWWIMDIGVRPRDKTPKSGVAHCKLSPSQESENEQIQNKIDALFYFDSQGIVHKEFVPPGQTVNQTFLSGNPWKTQEKGGTCAPRHCTHLDAASRQRPMSHGILHQWIFGRKNITVAPQPPYSPDLSPCDFFLLPRLKNRLKGRHFSTLDNIQKSVTDELKGIPAEAFQHCCEQWKHASVPV